MVNGYPKGISHSCYMCTSIRYTSIFDSCKVLFNFEQPATTIGISEALKLNLHTPTLFVIKQNKISLI